MNDSRIQQRIAYLVEHGGIYPKPRPPWLPWAVAIMVIQLVSLGVMLVR